MYGWILWTFRGRRDLSGRSIQRTDERMGTAMFSESKKERRIRQSVLCDRQSAEQKIGKLYHDRYQIQGMIGKGGMGKVFLAEDIKTGKKVAVKIVEDQNQWEREREILKRLSQVKGIPKLFFAESKQEKILVMEYISGSSLKQYQRNCGKLKKKESLLWMIKICTVLEHIHKNGIIHMDLKPENIIVTSREIYLIDFGVSLFEGERLNGYGTKNYASKKQAKRQEMASVFLDIYSFGKTMESVLSMTSDLRKIIDRCVIEEDGKGYGHVWEIKRDLKKMIWKIRIKKIMIVGICLLGGQNYVTKMHRDHKSEKQQVTQRENKDQVKQALRYFYGDDKNEKDLMIAKEYFEEIIKEKKNAKSYLFLIDFLSGDKMDVSEKELQENLFACQKDIYDFWSAYFYLHFYVTWFERLKDHAIKEGEKILDQVQKYAVDQQQKELFKRERIDFYELMAEHGDDHRFLEETDRVFARKLEEEKAWELYQRKLTYLEKEQKDISYEFERFLKKYPKVMDAYIEYGIYLCQHSEIEKAKIVYLKGKKQTGMTSKRAQGLRRKLGL